MKQNNELDSDVPLLKGLKVGIIYNLKSGKKTEVADNEAEYDNIETVYALQSAIKKTGAEVMLLEANETLPERLMKSGIDIAFNIAEGKGGRGREAQIPAILNLYDIPCTGSDETTLCIALDKALTKRLLATYHVKTPQYTIIGKDGIERAGALKYPVIIKPNAEGSSKGISDVSIVENKKELTALAKKNIAAYHQDMLAEEYIEGREFTVGVLGNGRDIQVFSPMEIIYRCKTQGDYHVYSYNVKQDYKKYIDYKCPADIDKSVEDKMIKIAHKVYEALSCKDFARMDFRVTKDNEIYFIEINPLPGLAPNYSDYPMLADFCGMDYDTLVKNILCAAIKRHREDGALK